MVTDAAWLRLRLPILQELLGGAETARMLIAHQEGASVRQLAAEAGLPEATTRTKLARARMTLRRLP